MRGGGTKIEVGINYYLKHVTRVAEHELSQGWMLHEILLALDPSKQLLLDIGIIFSLLPQINFIFPFLIYLFMFLD